MVLALGDELALADAQALVGGQAPADERVEDEVLV